MSTKLVANIEELEKLSAKYKATGDSLSVRAQSIADRVRIAIDTFETSVTALVGKTKESSAVIQADVTALKAKTEATDWEGPNQVEFLAEMETFRSTITASATVIEEDVNGVKTFLDSTFRPHLEQFSAGLKTDVAKIDAAAQETDKAIATVKENIIEVGGSGFGKA
jgi:uncharacterized protein YukE